jgi:tRNA modification GTPase
MSCAGNTGQLDTIIAQATPQGRGGVAIVRISGVKVPQLIAPLLGKSIPPRQAIFAHFYAEPSEIIDSGLALYFPAPHSFTGEEVLELHCHGSPVIVDMLLERLLALGTRLARPGEFSERAFLNNKMDLTQAEAVADLIDAASRKAVRLAMRSLQGEFAHHIQTLVKKIIKVRTFIEAAIDFSDEEIDFLSDHTLSEQLSALLSELHLLEKNAQQGSKLREGIKVVITGAPNVGKSSLLNALSAQEIAIVTSVPGTTRDILRNQISLDGLQLQMVDTAGIRESEDAIEQEGIKRAQQELQTADLILHVLDATENQTLAKVPKAPPHTLYVYNKVDLLAQPMNDEENIYISARTGAGLMALQQAIKQKVGLSENSEGIFLARRRHLHQLHQAKQHLESSHALLQKKAQAELIAEELRVAQLALNEITGEFSSDDLLGEIFSTFCIGK